MTVVEILKSVSLYLDLYEDFEGYFNNDLTSVSDETKSEYQKVLLAINNVCEKLAEIFMLKTKEQIEIKNKTLALNELVKRFKEVKNIYKVSDNKSVSYKVFDDYIYVDYDGEVVIEYFYYPDKVTQLNDKIAFNFINERTIALGVNSEYCFMLGLFDDAKEWEERFLKELKNFSKLAKGFILPKRKWEI